jgi:hypothetical protein
MEEYPLHVRVQDELSRGFGEEGESLVRCISPLTAQNAYNRQRMSPRAPTR